jgi:hypothetical protein
VGARFKCDKCLDYDLCSTCLENRVVNKKHTNEHPMILRDLQHHIQINVNDIQASQILGEGGFGKNYSIFSISSMPFFSI